MPLLLSEVYDALLEGGTSDAKARAAATAIADYHNRLVAIEGKVDRLDTRITALDSKVTWMFGVGFSMLLLTLGGVFTIIWRQITL
jgi:hypothetical protein